MGATHGNRILVLGKAAEDSFEGVGGEAGALAFAAEIIFELRVHLRDGHCQASQHGRSLRHVALADATSVLCKSYIQHPVQAALDRPVAANRRGC